jgi:hypothetical protein
MDLVPLDDDLLSLELERPFADCTLDGDASSLFAAAAAIARLQQQFGLIPRIQVGGGGLCAGGRDRAGCWLTWAPPAAAAPPWARARL